MRFVVGQTVVRRDLHPDGRVYRCACGRVISDDERGLLLWMDARSALVRPVTLDGRPTRARSSAGERRVPTIPSLSTWHPEGGALILTPPDVAYSLLWFFDGAGVFRVWYVNLEAPALRWWGGVDIHDQVLDVLVAPDLTWQWKDEEEFADLTGHPEFWDEAQAAMIRVEGVRLIELAESGGYPFDGTWCDFRPDPSWPPCPLPWWWDQPSGGEPATGAMVPANRCS